MMHSPDRVSALIVSTTHSGAGKTTASASIVRGLRSAGLRVQPFELGLDFIDSAYLAEAAGRPAVNLDLWMMGADGMQGSFRRWSDDADIAVIEAMGWASARQALTSARILKVFLIVRRSRGKKT